MENNNEEKLNNSKAVKKDVKGIYKDQKKFIETEERIEKKSIYDTELFKAYQRRKKNKVVDKADLLNKGFNPFRAIKILLCLLFIIVLIVAINKINEDLMNSERFRSVSTKIDQKYSNKDQTVYDSLGRIKELKENNKLLSPTNLNLINLYDSLDTEEDTNTNNPRPNILTEVVKERTTMDSVAGQVFTKLMNNYDVFKNNLYLLGDTRPVNIVRQYGYSGYSILSKYNPEDETHKLGKPSTYFINNFTNVNISYKNGDGEEIDEYSNIKDIMSMASVYTYYHNPKDIKTFSHYCDTLYNSSITFTPHISPIYFCTGCMNYTPKDIATVSNATSSVISVISNEPIEQKAKELNRKKIGTINRMDSDNLEINRDTYEDYLDNVDNINIYNYCPGHVDLNIDVCALTLDESNGLIGVDTIGKKGTNWTVNWHGWDILKKSKAIELSNKDWSLEYGLTVSYVHFLKPLTQAEINYYLSRLDSNIDKDRFKVIEAALKSVGKIPYYYGGKPRSKDFAKNQFGTLVRPDYKGRILSGLDCSGWITWVYWTAFDKKVVRSEGTNTMATEGKKIRRSELKPGDIIVRPGYDSHVMLFMEWAENGRMKVIHENGSVNNVSVATVEGYYPYYRNLLD